jgi:outer membrane protein OmpA-like peptidoglycan-associated protein
MSIPSHKPVVALALALVALLALAPDSRAETGDFNLHLEVGPGFPLTGWQADELGVGLFAAGRFEISLAQWIGVEAGGGYLGFFRGAHPPGYAEIDGAYFITAVAGLRLRPFNDEQGYLWSWGDKPDHTGNLWGNLWIDMHGAYFNTGGAHRFGADAGIGLELSIVNGLQLGPFARGIFVYQPQSDNLRDSQDAWILVAGLGGSLAIPPEGKRLPDTDGDGLYDPSDRCPAAAEDYDEFEDADGCPDEDNDGDGLLDADDECPLEPEDPDGFEDGDGCPDEDNDGDGLLDADDECPDQPEDADGFEDRDGCPDLDNDGDKILDVDDKCPDEAETRNKHLDDDGCPEPDDDDDGFANDVDECPDQPETFNGVDDDDGCPDDALVKVEEDRILGGDRVFFGRGRVRFKHSSRPTLKQLAELLANHPEYTLVSIDGHADRTGPPLVNLELSRLRAERVRSHLIKLGIAPERLTVRAFGEDQPWQKGRAEAFRSKNRRVEFRILDLDIDLATGPVLPSICRALGRGADCAKPAEELEAPAGTEDAKE